MQYLAILTRSCFEGTCLREAVSIMHGIYPSAKKKKKLVNDIREVCGDNGQPWEHPCREKHISGPIVMQMQMQRQVWQDGSHKKSKHASEHCFEEYLRLLIRYCRVLHPCHHTPHCGIVDCGCRRRLVERKKRQGTRVMVVHNWSKRF